MISYFQGQGRVKLKWLERVNLPMFFTLFINKIAICCPRSTILVLHFLVFLVFLVFFIDFAGQL